MSNVCFYLRRTRVFSQLNRRVWDGYSNSLSSFYAQKKSAFLAPCVLPSAQISFSGTICLGMYSLPSSSPFPPRAQTHNKALPGWLAVSWDGHLVTTWKELLKLQTAGWRGLAKQEIGLSVSAQSRGGRLCLFVQRKIEKGNHSLIPVSTSK